MNEKHGPPSVPVDIKRDLSISMGKAYVFMFVIVGPLWVALIILYCALWGIGNLLEGLARLTDWSSIIPILVIGVPLHEIIHGLTWAYVGRKPLKSIRFGFQWKSLTPYAHCRVPIQAGTYRWGAVMPAVLLGFLPYALGLIMGHGWFAVFGLLFILAAGGDLLVLWLIRAVKQEALVEDHPSRAGCYVYEQSTT